jgi:hypothetical protein
VSNFGRVRRDHDGRIGITLWDDDEHMLTDAQAADLIFALTCEVNGKTPLDKATTPSGHPLSESTKAAVREFVHRPQSDFGKPVTFHGDTGPIVPVDPTIAAKDSA